MIVYKKGIDNRVADALSRVSHQPSSELAAISVSQPTWLKEIQQAYLQDEAAMKLLSELSVSSPVGHYSLHSGLIYYKHRIWVGNTISLH